MFKITLPLSVMLSINSKGLKKDDIFFAIKGKKNDGSKFLNDAYTKKSSLMITHRLVKAIPLIFLKFLE